MKKVSFGHFSTFYAIKISERLKLQYFASSYNEVKLLLSCNTIKNASISYKTK